MWIVAIEATIAHDFLLWCKIERNIAVLIALAKMADFGMLWTVVRFLVFVICMIDFVLKIPSELGS